MSPSKADSTVRAMLAHRLLTTTDDVWRQLHEGRITAEEAAARRRGEEPDDAIEQAKAVFGEPFAARDAQRFDEVLRLYEGAPEAAPRSRSRKWWLTGGGMALAAAVLLWLLRPSSALVTYEAELQRQLAGMRGTAEVEGIPEYRQDRSIEIWLRPMEAVDEPIAAEVHALQGDELRRLPATPVVMDGGIVHIVETVEALGLTPGEWDLVLVVGRAGDLPERFDASLARDPPDDGSYTVIVTPIRIVPAPAADVPHP